MLFCGDAGSVLCDSKEAAMGISAALQCALLSVYWKWLADSVSADVSDGLLCGNEAVSQDRGDGRKETEVDIIPDYCGKSGRSGCFKICELRYLYD